MKIIAAVIAALAIAGAAQAGARWDTEAQALKAAKAYGFATKAGGTARPVSGFCHGTGTAHGSFPTPRYQRFRCTLVFATGAGTAWYDLIIRTTGTARMQIVKIIGRY